MATNAVETEVTEIGEGSPAGETCPASETTKMTAGELKAKEAAQAAEREARANKVKGPRKLNENERAVVKDWLDKYLTETDPVDKVVKFADLDKDLIPYFQPSMKDNVVARGVFNAVYDPETKALSGVHLTEIGATLYTQGLRKTKANDGGPTGRVSRGALKTKAVKTTRSVRSNKYPDTIRLRKMHETNPRRAESHGHYSYDMYENGMTFSQYLNKEYNKALITQVGTAFDGPKRVHWDWDVVHGNIALYYEDRPEFLEDGSPNPEFWYVNFTQATEENEVEDDLTEETIDEAAE
jgi:hypothetical protein